MHLEEIVEEHRENIRQSHDEFASKLTEFEKSLSDLHKAKVECQAEAEAAKQAVQKQADDIMKILKTAVVQTHQMINMEAGKKISEIEEKEKKLLQEISEIPDILKQTGVLMQSENAASIIDTSINKIPQYRRVLENITVGSKIPKMTLKLQLPDVNQFTRVMLLGKLDVTKQDESTKLSTAGATLPKVSISTH